MSEVNLFEIATRKQFRFTSTRGDLSVEQLWELPLTSRSQFDLDSVARLVNTELKAVTEQSFVVTRSTKGTELQQKLDLVLHIIRTKQSEAQSAVDAQHKAQQRQVLVDLISQRDHADLAALSKEELQKRLADLG